MSVFFSGFGGLRFYAARSLVRRSLCHMETERRLESRSLCAELVKIGWPEGDGGSQTTSAVLEDISTHGACLQTEVPVPLGVEAFIQHQTWIIRCRVAYCLFREIGYFVGVTFEDGAKWSQEEFEPRHLLNLTKLAGHARRAG